MIGQTQQVQPLVHGRFGFADQLAQGLRRVPQVDQRPVSRRLFDRVQAGSVGVLEKPDLGRLFVGEIADRGINRLQAQPLAALNLLSPATSSNRFRRGSIITGSKRPTVEIDSARLARSPKSRLGLRLGGSIRPRECCGRCRGALSWALPPRLQSADFQPSYSLCVSPKRKPARRTFVVSFRGFPVFSRRTEADCIAVSTKEAGNRVAGRYTRWQ